MQLLTLLALFLVIFISSTSANNLFSYTVRDANGGSISLSKYENAKVLLIGKIETMMMMMIIDPINSFCYDLLSFSECCE